MLRAPPVPRRGEKVPRTESQASPRAAAAQDAGRWTLDAGMAVSLLHLSLGRAEDERPPGHGVEPPAQLGPGVRAEVSQPPPRARLDWPLSPAASRDHGCRCTLGVRVEGTGAEETPAFLQGVPGGRRPLSSPSSGERGRSRPWTSRGGMGGLGREPAPPPGWRPAQLQDSTCHVWIREVGTWAGLDECLGVWGA